MDQQQNNNLENTLRKVVQEEVRSIVKEEIEPLKDRFDLLEKDVGTLKSDVGTLKSDMRILKEDMEKFQLEMKQDFQEFGGRAFKTFATKEDLRQMEERIIEQTKWYRDRILADNDKVFGKMLDLEQEQNAGAVLGIDRDERLDNLEEDMKQVKHKLGLAPSVG